MSLINLTPADLDAFLSVAETNSFRQSAQLLGISQPAVSSRIRHLEAVLGVRLFHRTTRRVLISDAGEKLRIRVERMVLETRAIVREFKDAAHLQRGRVVLGASPSVAAGLLPMVIGDFRQRSPDIDVVLYDDFFGRALDRVSRGEVDMAVIPFEPDDNVFAFEPLLNDVFQLAVPKAHRLSRQSSVTLSEVAAEKLISMPPDSAAWATLRRAFTITGFDFDPTFVTRNSLTMFGLIKQGIGVGLVTKMLSSAIDMRGITLLPVHDADFTRSIGIVQVRDKMLTPAAQKLRKLLRSNAKQYKPGVSASA